MGAQLFLKPPLNLWVPTWPSLKMYSWGKGRMRDDDILVPIMNQN